ncbi:hypothetical protein CAPTEDRAFT_224958 [Capitella teleta]|uniref:receptor protein-tyrosine kinase n=1 Tax=Capitella teleta TaxID=283909 RepID=R7U4C7_CAPTE|nr:hypothetical protein CAPTEDRAFT_224958 [Capitella teleta]|eukprot:ELT98025.1 hypothetical protein CAPTEDRAFT_224958 [Capitella teleta]
MLADIQVDRSKLTLNEVLIEGTFGRMYHGLMHIEDDVPVVVKTVTDAARPDQSAVILRDGCLLKGLIHPNVHGIMAVCLPTEKSSPVLVYPHASESNLKKFLQRCKLSEMHQPLNTQQIVFMAIQVTRGVQFLHRKRIVHKDIAARNCVVDHQFNVKVTDTALARDFFPNDYHCLGDNENRPIKWLALESLMERRFTPASDVWSFGVLIWELLTLALQPYADVDPFEMAGYLKEGFRIAQPLNCPDEIFAVMACCWALNPDERPKFAQLQVCLQDFYSALGNFV